MLYINLSKINILTEKCMLKNYQQIKIVNNILTNTKPVGLVEYLKLYKLLMDIDVHWIL